MDTHKVNREFCSINARDVEYTRINTHSKTQQTRHILRSAVDSETTHIWFCAIDDCSASATPRTDLNVMPWNAPKAIDRVTACMLQPFDGLRKLTEKGICVYVHINRMQQKHLDLLLRSTPLNENKFIQNRKTPSSNHSFLFECVCGYTNTHYLLPDFFFIINIWMES